MNKNSEKKIGVFLETDIDSLPIEKIGDFLKRGDQTLIAEATGYVLDYVQKVLNRERHNEIIVEVARLVLKDRQLFFERIKELKVEYQLKRFERGI